MSYLRASLAAAAVLTLLALLGAAVPAAAQDGEAEFKGSIPFPGGSADSMVGPLQPIRDRLSGSTWLFASGLDERAVLRREGVTRERPQVESPILQAAGGAGAALVPYRDPSAKFSRNILVTRDFSLSPVQTEPSLALDPTDPDHLLLGVIDYNFPTISTYVTFDGGVTWEGPSLVPYPRAHLGSVGDPVMAFDSHGNSYAVNISVKEEEFRFGPFYGAAIVSSIQVTRSADGKTWGVPAVTDRLRRIQARVLPGGSPDRPRGLVAIDFLDKPWFTIGKHPSEPGRDVLYVTYTKFRIAADIAYLGELPVLVPQSVETVIEAVRSEDGGASWSQPFQVSSVAREVLGGAIGGDGDGGGGEAGPESTRQRVIQGSQVSVAPDGTAYITWFDSTDDRPFEGRGELYVSRSDDGGRTYTSPRRIATVLEPPFRPRSAFFRYWATAFPQVAAGADGNVYVAYTALPSQDPEDDGDIFVLRSADKGETWTRPQRINDDSTARVQFFPSLDVDPKGNVHVMWADMRDDPKSTEYHIYYTSSEDKGATWAPNSRVTDTPSNPGFAFRNGLFIGDYFTLKASATDVYMAWADSRLGNITGLNQKIGFARKRVMPRPEVFLSPPKGPGGQDVVIQGFNFQPNELVFVSLAGSIVATARTSTDGRLNVGLFLPVAGQGAHEMRVFDASGNLATGSFFMEFGFGDIQKATQDIQRTLATAPAAAAASGTGAAPGTGILSSQPAAASTEVVVWRAIAFVGLVLAVLALVAATSATRTHARGPGSA